VACATDIPTPPSTTDPDFRACWLPFMCTGQYRVLAEGEAVPTIKSIRRDSGPNLLSAAKGSVVRVAKMRKGQVFFRSFMRAALSAVGK
jgi:hypothetical protein